MVEFLCRVRVDGGTKAIFNEMQPSFAVGGDLIMSRIYPIENPEDIALGEWFDAIILLPYGEKYEDYIVEGTTYALQLASRKIGKAEIMEAFSAGGG